MVSQPQLALIANNATRYYGATNPAFTGSITGSKYNDAFSEDFNTTATITSAVSSYAIVPAASGPNLSDYTVLATNGTLTVSQAPTATALTLSSMAINPGQTVTLNTTVASTTSGLPTGSVIFFDNGSVLQTLPLTGGTSSYVATLSAGMTHVLSVGYLGDTNFLTSSSPATGVTVTVAPLDLTFSQTGTSASAVAPGGVAAFAFAVSPSFSIYAAPVTFSVAGLPPGATASFTPSTIPVSGGAQTVTLSVQTAAPQAHNHIQSLPLPNRIPPAVVALLLLPVIARRKLRSKLGARILTMVFLIGSLAGAAAMVGCGTGAGFLLQQPQAYTLTVTATEGSLVHTVTVTLNVQ
jgi:hypothetical protein